MSVNNEIIGKTISGGEFEYDEDTVILYALGIGIPETELDFIYERNLRVFPTFAVITYQPLLFKVIEQAGLSLPTILHGEQHLRLNQAFPTQGTVQNTAICDSIYDKGDKGAVLNVDIRTMDQNGELLAENRVVIMDRASGNFGGERGAKGEKVVPPEGKDPDFSIKYQTAPNQAALYRLSGDKNPLHVDPEFAQKGGFEKPILHGLCTMGFAGRAVLSALCGNEPEFLKGLSVRFTGVVYPGDTLTTEGWKLDDSRYAILTRTQEGRVVLGNGLAEIRHTPG